MIPSPISQRSEVEGGWAQFRGVGKGCGLCSVLKCYFGSYL